MESDEKACPFCAETIKAAAIKCRYCGESLAVVEIEALSEAPASEAEPVKLGVPVSTPDAWDHLAELAAQPSPPATFLSQLGCLTSSVGACFFFVFSWMSLWTMAAGIVLATMGLVPKPWSRRYRFAIMVCLVFTVFMAYAAYKTDTAPSASAVPPNPFSQVTLKGPTFLGATSDVLSQATDKESANVYLMRGELWLLNAGTKIKSTDPGLLTSKVIVLDGPHLGVEGYVISEALRQ